ncbi:hypothetical protein CNMCM6106_009302 [Aspergillus hiratsukae]|uniref:Uncharacterized protein n=1 Tax=Aspergillus hiratsukae TaxID=1194566 RepID=A0A8H6QIL8_9EURO|nr:hypothetical protein CNMCM6106_009302 [Aspergillus hiratsukae]
MLFSCLDYRIFLCTTKPPALEESLPTAPAANASERSGRRGCLLLLLLSRPLLPLMRDPLCVLLSVRACARFKEAEEIITIHDGGNFHKDPSARNAGRGTAVAPVAWSSHLGRSATDGGELFLRRGPQLWFPRCPSSSSCASSARASSSHCGSSACGSSRYTPSA